MSNYYLNAGSSSQDGLTPSTGYHNFGILQSDRTLLTNDHVLYVANGIITETSNINLNVSITMESYSGNTSIPIWKLSDSFNTIGGGYADYMKGLYVTATALEPANITANNDMEYHECIFDGCTVGAWNDSYEYTLTALNCIFKNALGHSLIDMQGSIHDCIINNCVFYNARVLIETGGTTRNAYIINNIFSGGTDAGIWGINNPTIFFIDYNIDFNTSLPYNFINGLGDVDIPRTSVGSHNITGDPKFVNPSGGDFSLQLTSPCIDAGVDHSSQSTVPTTDIVGTTRPQGVHTDIGAYEMILGPSAPHFDVQPVNTSIAVGQTLTLTSHATGSPTPTYQWYKDDNPISLATDRIYTKDLCTIDDSGTYYVIATNSEGTDESDHVTVTVSYGFSTVVIENPGTVSTTTINACEFQKINVQIINPIKLSFENNKIYGLKDTSCTSDSVSIVEDGNAQKVVVTNNTLYNWVTDTNGISVSGDAKNTKVYDNIYLYD